VSAADLFAAEALAEAADLRLVNARIELDNAEAARDEAAEAVRVVRRAIENAAPHAGARAANEHDCEEGCDT